MTLSRLSVVVTLIDNCINNDEGGWKLTSNPNDPDGGWTFAGVTSKTWNAWNKFPDGYKYTAQDMKNHIAEDIVAIKEKIYTIYDEVFYQPLIKECKWNIGGYKVHPAVFSCAVNIGVEYTENILATMKYEDYRLEVFLLKWRDYYLDLCKKNAEAWQTYVNDLELELQNHDRFMPDGKRPTTLRIENLKGWLNRIERYSER